MDDSSISPPIGLPLTRLRRFLALQPVRFLFVGGLNTLIGFLLYSAFFLVIHRRLTAVVASTAAGMLVNFFTTGRLVFANRNYRALVPFCVGYGLVLGANLLALSALARLGVGALLSQAIALPPLVVLSYLMNRYVIFARASKPGN